MNSMQLKPDDRVLVTGATGFIGRKLVIELLKKQVKLRLLVRDRAKAAALFPAPSEVQLVRADVLKNEGLREALQGIHTAYYLVHSLGGRTVFQDKEFARKDAKAAEQFTTTAGAEGVKRIIYLGGLGGGPRHVGTSSKQGRGGEDSLLRKPFAHAAPLCGHHRRARSIL